MGDGRRGFRDSLSGGHGGSGGAMFKRILIANRGEIALRVIRACRELGIETVAVFSEADADSPHLREADRTVCLGPAKSAESYLNMEAILQAAEQTECGAVHPGYGFLSENALFAELCEQAKMTFIGPPASAIRAMGDKATARETMREAGLPVIPGSQGDSRPSVRAGRELAREIGFPVLLKATAGGGGKGMRRVDAAEEFAPKFREASLEAEKAFGNAGLYLEKYIVDGRHIEFQVMADAFGNVVHLGERECSVQRRHQKLVEESPSPVMDAGDPSRARREVCDAPCAHRLSERRYDGVLPRPGRPALLHGGERPAPGRAPGDRDGHRTSIWCWNRSASRRTSRSPSPRRRSSWPATPSSAGSTPRIPSTISSPVRARSRSSSRPRRISGGPGPRRHARASRVPDPGPLRLDDRQADRVGPGSRRRPGGHDRGAGGASASRGSRPPSRFT